MRSRDFDVLIAGPDLGPDDDLIPGGSIDPISGEGGAPPAGGDPQAEPTPDPAEPEPGPGPRDDTPDVAGPVDNAVPDAPVGQAPVEAPAVVDYQTISAARILEDRPDVLRAYYEEFYKHSDAHSTAWKVRVGGDTPEAYATYWYNKYGRYEGYAQSPTTAKDNISLARILEERPDVLKAYYEGYYRHNDSHSTAWKNRVGGDTPEDYAKYWYDRYGKWEGYAQSDKAAAENISVERLLLDRPDVFRAFYTEFYGAGNDRHSKAWIDRVGGDTVQDYAKYWYETYGKHEGYTQAPAAPAPAAPAEPDPPAPPPPADDPSPVDPPVLPDAVDTVEDQPQPDAETLDMVAFDPFVTSDEAILSIGRAFGDPEIFG